MLNSGEEKLVERLRKEAYDVKDCFTKFSFQALGLSAVVLGLIVRFQIEFPLTGFASVPVIAFLLLVARIGLHKYETANRLYGYELHLHRRTRLKESETGGWQKYMRNIGWEEAFHAWRVVQPEIYEHLYKKYPWVRPTQKTSHYRNANPKWFEAGALAGDERPAYYAGSYLQKLHFVLHSFAFMACLPLVYMCWQLYQPSGCPEPCMNEAQQVWAFRIAVVVAAGTWITIAIRTRRVNVKRHILEKELLSINSCAILWLAVVVAHFRALADIGADRDDQTLPSYEGYTVKLAGQAKSLRDHMPYIYNWVNQAPTPSGTPPNA